MVDHNSRVHILDNVIVGADGTGIFLEDSTETGPVINNCIIGTGGGWRRWSIFNPKRTGYGAWRLWYMV